MKPRDSVGRTTRDILAAIGRVALVPLLASTLGGCSKKIHSELLPNQPPEVRLTAAPTVKDKTRPEYYAISLQWAGFDPDGRVDHYLTAVDPIHHAVDERHPTGFDLADTCWHTTVRKEQTVFFSAGSPIEPINPRDPRAEDPHEFAVFAVDDQGAVSKLPADRAFWSFTQAPTVFVTDPRPNASFGLNLTPSVTIRWSGTDPDGQFHSKPIRWVFKLFSRTNPDYPSIPDYIRFATANPDSFRKQYAKSNFAGWNSTGADTTSFKYTGLSQQSWLFVVTGFDEAGAYDPIFTLGRNMLEFSVIFASTAGPLIRMYNQFFDYEYVNGGIDEGPDRWFKLEAPADEEVTFNWDATPAKGADIKRFRWTLDQVDLSDETARTIESDWTEKHWSAWSRLTTSATIGPFRNNAEKHLFYIEAEDDNGLLSLGIIQFTVVKATFDGGPRNKDVLVVDDTRFLPDFRDLRTGIYTRPLGPWPARAELDTFLFAVGGKPWMARYENPQPVSPGGVFNGYAFDTIGTRGVSLDGLVPLSLLGRYRCIVWMIDDGAASYNQPPNDQVAPISAMRLMNSRSRPNLLATYLAQARGRADAGFVWLLGGGAAAASLAAFNNIINSGFIWTFEAGELQPGRTMYDIPHWQAGIAQLPSVGAVRFGSSRYGEGDNRPGREWPVDPPLPTPQNPPDYSALPVRLSPKDPSTDPLPPGRTSEDYANFYQGYYTAEFIFEPTFIRENYGPDVDHLREYSTLDTLYLAVGAPASPRGDAPVMTYYHGRDCQPFIFSGFNIWYWRLPDSIGLIDWVLHSVWHLERDPLAPRGPVGTTLSAHRAAR